MGYISNVDFIDGLLILFTETFENLAKFIFKLYDYDKDGKINKEDIRIVLSYIPINTMTKFKSTMVYEK
jgi:Ca2+-binding EF-hand superfamily protein